MKDNYQELIQSNPTPIGKSYTHIHLLRVTKGTRGNRMNSSLSYRWSISTLIEFSGKIYFTYFLFLNHKSNQTGSRMGSCYSSGHISGDHIHTDITTCNTEEA